MANALNEFRDFVATTGPSIFTGPDKVVNEAVKNTYFLANALRGRPMHEILQGGEKIQDTILFEDNGSYGNYDPNEVFNPTNPQLTTTYEALWRYSKGEYVWTDHEVKKNAPSTMSAQARFHQFKNLKRIKEQGAWTSIINGMEDALWALPNAATMQTTGAGGTQQSIPTFITEDTTTYMPSGFSDIQGISATAEEKWRNQVATYDHTDPFDESTGLISAIDDIYEDLRFEQPPTRQQYFESDALQRQNVATSKQGINLYRAALRNANDRLVQMQDAGYNRPAIYGIPVMRVSTLDDAPLYTSAVEAAGEPRFYFINFNYMKVFFHAERYFHQTEPMNGVHQPYTWTVYIDCWWNMFCTSRMRQGIIAPVNPSN